jgi:hypothetical protein
MARQTSITIPDKFNEADLGAELGLRLRGMPAGGSRQPSLTTSAATVIWIDAGDEVLVHLDSVQVRMLNGTLLVSVDLETDQTGCSPLVVAFSLGAGDPAGLVATTDEVPRGHPVLASRWGRPLQAAVWAGLLGLAKDHAIERNAAPQAIQVLQGELSLQAGQPAPISPGSPGLPGRHDGHGGHEGQR